MSHRRPWAARTPDSPRATPRRREATTTCTTTGTTAMTTASTTSRWPPPRRAARWRVRSCRACLSGLAVESAHGNGLLSYYGHLSEIDVARGQYVLRGQVL